MNDERRAEYKAYLASPLWQEKRKVALERAEHRCQLCNRTKQLDVHHRTYERFGGEELPGDLTVLCRGCHEHFHDGRRAVSRSKPPPPPPLSIPEAQQRVALAVENDLIVGKSYTSGAIAGKAGVRRHQAVPTLDWLSTGIRIGDQELRLRKTRKKKWILELPESRTEPVPILNGRKRQLEAKSKTEARDRVRVALQKLEPGQVYATADIAVLAEVQVSRVGGFLAGMANRDEGVQQLGNGRWRRTSSSTQAYAA